MFRPRFRLSLLFVLAALVAGVSVWLRQAVVRDRNIRALLAEEWVVSDYHKLNPEHAIHLNTRFLNFIHGEQRYCDRILKLEIHPHHFQSQNDYQKYKELNLGDTLSSLSLSTQNYNEPNTKVRGHRPIAFSQVLFWANHFQSIETLHISYGTIVDDLASDGVINAVYERLFVLNCELNTSTVIKLIESRKQRVKTICLMRNCIHGTPKDLLAITDNDVKRLEYYVENNEFE